MRRSLLFVLFLFSVSALSAQSYTAVKSDSTVIKKIKKKSKNLRTISANFTETVKSSVIAKPTVSTGKVYYQKSNKLRWEKNAKSKEVIIVKGSDVKYYVGGKKVENSGSKRLVKRVQSLMMNVITSDFVDQKDFKVKYEENSSKYKLTLTPKKASVSKYISHIELFLSKSDMSLKEFVIYETKSDYVSYKFSAVKYNQSLNKSLFEKL